jgi:hypothetical protein
MARARNIKPGFCTNEDLAECSFEARLCFAMLPMIADREGRLEDRPKRIKGELFRFDSLDVEPLLAELEQHGFIVRYEVNGLDLIQIIAFAKHQNPHHREPESTLPPPPSLRLDMDGKYSKPEASVPCNDCKASGKPEADSGCDPSKASDQPKARHGFDPPTSDLPRGSSRVDSGALIPDSGTMIPEKEKEPPIGGKKKKPAKRCPPDFELTADLRAWAADAVPGVDVQGETEAFRDHEFRAGHTDWQGTWRNWMRRAAKDSRTGARRAPATTGETSFQKNQRDKIAQFAPGIAARAPTAREPEEAIDVAARFVG